MLLPYKYKKTENKRETEDSKEKKNKNKRTRKKGITTEIRTKKRKKNNNKGNIELNIRNQACREQQIQQTKADVVKKQKTRKITSRRTKKINIYVM